MYLLRRAKGAPSYKLGVEEPGAQTPDKLLLLCLITRTGKNLAMLKLGDQSRHAVSPAVSKDASRAIAAPLTELELSRSTEARQHLGRSMK